MRRLRYHLPVESERVGEGSVLGGRFILERELGRTESVRVFRAHDTKYDEVVGITVFLDPPTNPEPPEPRPVGWHGLPYRDYLGLARLSDFGSHSRMRLGQRRGQICQSGHGYDRGVAYVAWFVLPRVLKEPPHRPNNFSAVTRQALLRAAQGCCELCGSDEGVQVDHIVPVAHDGTADPSNGMVLCRTCHRAKSKVQAGCEVYQRPARQTDAAYYVSYAGGEDGPFVTTQEMWRMITLYACGFGRVRQQGAGYLLGDAQARDHRKFRREAGVPDATECAGCGNILSLRAAPHREVHHVQYCASCIGGVREGTVDLTCIKCRIPQPARSHFKRAGNSKVGYLFTCKICSGDPVSKDVRAEWLRRRVALLGELRRPSLLEQRENEARRRRMRAHAGRAILRTLVGTPHLPMNQVIYALVDPRTREVRYVGQTHDPQARYEGHLRSGSDKLYGSESQKEWLDSLKALNLQPEMVILEQVEPSAHVYEREFRWILHYLHEGAALTNDAVVPMTRMAEAVRSTTLDYVGEPLDSDAWAALFDAWWEDEEEHRRTRERRARARLLAICEVELAALQTFHPSHA